jgi:preprotein translocase SecE subunit
MATAVVPPGGQPPSLPARVVGFYNGVMVELKRVTWPDVPQVRSATIAIIIFVLLLALVISAVDFVLQGLLVKLLPSLFAR